jgi:curved DNA-binding protein CbpA
VGRGKAIKAVFFEGGIPRFAISNLTTEQLEHKLASDGLASAEQIEHARKLAGKANQLGPALVQMGALTDDLMRKAVRDQVMAIVMSLFEWDQGDYVFDERIRADHQVTLDCTAADILLEGARHAANIHPIADAIAPPDGVVIRSRMNGSRMDTGKLMPIESYVLSRIDTPTAVSEVGALSGVPEEDARRAVCALVAAGLLKLASDEKDEDEEAADKTEASMEELRDEVSRRLHFFTTADHYEVLEITRQSTTGDIKTAYYGLAKKFHPDRYHEVPRDSELRGQLEAVFSKLTQAYDVLKEPAQRAAYDAQIRKPSGALRKQAPIPLTPDVRVDERKLSTATRKTGALIQPSGQRSTDSAAAASTQHVAHETQPDIPAAGAPAGRTAEYYFQQGRARFERKEYHAAVHLLREAVKLDPARPQYHLHLGVALITNPRTRREAEQHLAKSAELDPYNSQVRAKLGMVYKEAGLPKKAEHYFREALNIDPENRVAKRELGTDKKQDAASLWKWFKK